jgi:hypothetical protein
MKTYSIGNKVSGAHLGTYDGETEKEALDAMARDAGYRDYVHASQETGTNADELVVTELA